MPWPGPVAVGAAALHRVPVEGREAHRHCGGSLHGGVEIEDDVGRVAGRGLETQRDDDQPCGPREAEQQVGAEEGQRARPLPGGAVGGEHEAAKVVGAVIGRDHLQIAAPQRVGDRVVEVVEREADEYEEVLLKARPVMRALALCLHGDMEAYAIDDDFAREDWAGGPEVDAARVRLLTNRSARQPPQRMVPSPPSLKPPATLSTALSDGDIELFATMLHTPTGGFALLDAQLDRLLARARRMEVQGCGGQGRA